MKPHRRKRLGIIIFIAVSLSLSAGLTVYALRQNIDLFYTPTQIANGEVLPGEYVRIGGMVKEGSFAPANDSLEVAFITTDFASDVHVEHEGILPDLFREGQGVVIEGMVDSEGVFQASKVLAKHDENYMSQEVRAALDAAEESGAVPEANRY